VILTKFVERQNFLWNRIPRDNFEYKNHVIKNYSYDAIIIKYLFSIILDIYKITTSEKNKQTPRHYLKFSLNLIYTAKKTKVCSSDWNGISFSIMRVIPVSKQRSQ
jgi:hypothetical protein